MNIVILGVLAFVAVAAAVPNDSNVYMDIYRHVLGNPLQRIYKGKNASRGQFKHQASIRWGLLGVQSHICGGSLITQRTVVTAAHCKPYSFGTYDVVLGQLKHDDSDGQVFDVEQFILNPGYPGGSVVAGDDIAVINLKTAVTLSDTIGTIEIATGDQCNVGGKDLVASGFGLTSSLPIPPNHLKYSDVRGISNDECAADLIELLGEQGPLDDTMVCCGSDSDSYEGVCSGDSGGPLTSAGVLVGITSWGISPCGTKGAPSVFTSPCAHVDFINKNKLE